MAESDLNRVRFSGLDFDTHLDDELARLQVKFAASFNDFAVSSLGIVLLDMVAYGLDTLSFYLDRRATESYLATARTRKAIARLTRQLGYKMSGAVASSVDLTVGVTQVWPVNVTIPQGFKFNGPNNLVFEVAKATTFSTPSEQGSGKTKTVPVYEGETFNESFTSDGSASQVFTLRRVPTGKFVVVGTVSVLVNGSPFVESEFLEYAATDQFEVGYNDDPPTVRFGDGVAGNIPTAGASIGVTYVASSGKAGQVIKGTITKESTPLVVAGNTITLTVNNPSGSIGGDDLEDLEHAKVYAPKIFKTRLVAVTREDYQSLANAYADPLFGKVAIAQAISVRGASTDAQLQSLLTALQLVLDGLEPAINATTSAARLKLASIVSSLVTIASSLATISTAMLSIMSSTSTALTSARTSKVRTADITAAVTGILSQSADGKSAIDAVPAGVGDTLTVGTKTTLKSFFDRVISLAGDANSSALTISTNCDTETTALSTISTQVDIVGVNTGEAQLLVLDTQRASILTQVGASDGSSGLYRDLREIDGAMATVASTQAGYLAQIEAHVDSILSADCKANLVSVPILARNSTGFYAVPSIGLIQSLQAYLTARKEVTQTVVVSSGEDFLVYPVLTVRFGIRRGVSAAIAKASVSAAVDGVLRDRKFGQSLYISDLINVIRVLNGVLFVNVDIAGAVVGGSTFVSQLDSSGNLIITTGQVITKGSVGVTILDPEVLDS